jgi:protein-disulfide isomerase
LAPAFAQEGITREQAADILAELRMIRQLLEKAPPGVANGGAPRVPAAVSLALEGRAFLGKADAPITIVEFTDYQCPFCRQFHTTAFAEIKKNYIDTGRARFFIKDLPLDIHSNALKAAQAARCAGEQDQFWALREKMAVNSDKLQVENIFGWAKELGLKSDQFESCVSTEKYKSSIESDAAQATAIGANGTPAFVIGKTTPGGVEGTLLVGAMPYATFDKALRDLDSR